jgi:PAS domain S-box-containing protein
MSAPQWQPEGGEEYAEKLQVAMRRADGLRKRTPVEPAEAQLVADTLEELGTALEELQVAQEELRVQNEELERARIQGETERQRYLDLFEFAPNGYVVTDAEGAITDVNQAAAELLGGSGTRLAGKPLIVFVAPGDRSQFHVKLSQLLHGQDVGPQTVRVTPRWGEDERTVVVTVTPQRDPDTRRTRLRWQFVDVTEQRHAEEEVRAVNAALEQRVAERTDELGLANARLQGETRRKDEFLAMLAHELRNPLAPIVNSLHLLSPPELDPAVAGTARAMMDRQLHTMIRLVDDLLDVARITRGRITLHLEPVDLGTLAARAVETVRAFADERSHLLTVTVPHEPLTIRADATRMEQVIVNLLTNAIKYTEPNGTIGLTAQTDGATAVLRVRDTGIGMAAEFLPYVFDLFTQYDRDLDRAPGGLGIGLTLVRTLVERHGGTVDASSEGPGQGSEFIVRLPRHERGVASRERERPDLDGKAPAAPVPDSPGKRRVLVVDDNVDSAQSLASILRHWGHEVRVSHDGPSALDSARTEPPEVVLLDVGLPGMDGCELARHLRAEPTTAKAVLVALTGYGRDEDRQHTRDAGCDHHMVKPVNPDELRQLLAATPARLPVSS